MLREAAQALVVMAATLALGGLGTWLAPEPAAADYPMACMSESEQDEQGRVRLWLVDGFNVLHVGVLQGRDRRGWWKRERREELLERVKGFRAEHDGADVLVVFDGKHPPEPAHEADVPVVFAPSADEWLVRAVRDAERAESIAVVTADRRLADRVRRRGASVVAPRSFISRCGVPATSAAEGGSGA
jgi:predicted RNA-binding protein with PIN domain